jgi:hypothetical protein
MKPKYKIGEIVKVYEFYADEIVRDVYYGLIVDAKPYRFEGGCHFIYHVLPNEPNDRRGKRIQTAEEFAIERVEM